MQVLPAAVKEKHMDTMSVRSTRRRIAELERQCVCPNNGAGDCPACEQIAVLRQDIDELIDGVQSRAPWKSRDEIEHELAAL